MPFELNRGGALKSSLPTVAVDDDTDSAYDGPRMYAKSLAERVTEVGGAATGSVSRIDVRYSPGARTSGLSCKGIVGSSTPTRKGFDGGGGALLCRSSLYENFTRAIFDEVRRTSTERTNLLIVRAQVLERVRTVSWSE